MLELSFAAIKKSFPAVIGAVFPIAAWSILLLSANPSNKIVDQPVGGRSAACREDEWKSYFLDAAPEYRSDEVVLKVVVVDISSKANSGDHAKYGVARIEKSPEWQRRIIDPSTGYAI